jgi:dCTP deaminase
MFWGETLLRRRVTVEHLITPFDDARVDKAAYRLCVGPEVYISPTGEGDSRNQPKVMLSEGEPFSIPSGQFGFLLTEERVVVPNDAIAFISIRATYKFRGLVNVSGFHVDPDFEGRLLFSVFNAGPCSIHLSRGEECFLIWYAQLSEPGEIKKKPSRYNTIPSDLTGNLSNGLQSLASLDTRINQVEREQTIIKWASALAVGALITLLLKDCSVSRHGDPAQSPAMSTIQHGPDNTGYR